MSLIFLSNVALVQNPFIIRNTDAYLSKFYKVNSPWTGSSLTLYTYLHACLIWFALYQFWKVALKSTLFPHDKVREQFSKCRSGFEKGLLLDRVQNASPVISSDLQEVIKEAQEIVLNS